MNLFKSFNSVITKRNVIKTQSLFKQIVRHRYALDPGTLRERLFKAITIPILPPKLKALKVEDSARTIVPKPLGNYAEFLVALCRKEVIDCAKGKMLLVFQMNHCKKYNMFHLENTLFDHGLKFSKYPSRIMKLASHGTNLHVPIELLYDKQVFHYTVIGDCCPLLCDIVLTATKNRRDLLLLGGVLDYRIVNIDQIKEFSEMKSIEHVREALLGNLSANQNEIANNLSSHQNNLISILTELENRQQ